MNLKRYPAFIQDLLYTRQDIIIEDLFVEEIEPEVADIVEGRLRYWDCYPPASQACANWHFGEPCRR